MKKTLALLLSLAMLAGFATACEKTEDTEPTTTAAEDANTPETHSEDRHTEEYLEFMDEYIAESYAAITALVELLDQKDTIETKEEYVEWLRQFFPIKNEITRLSNNLATISHKVPDEYVEAHTKITDANTLALGAMIEFEDAIIDILNTEVAAVIVAVEQNDGDILLLIEENQELIRDKMLILDSKIRLVVAYERFEDAVGDYE